MSFATLAKALTDVCHAAAKDGDSIETIVGALHVVHESAMLTFKMHLSKDIAVDEELEESK